MMLIAALSFGTAIICFYMAHRSYSRCKNCGNRKSVLAGYCQICYDQIKSILKNGKHTMMLLADKARPDLTPEEKDEMSQTACSVVK